MAEKDDRVRDGVGRDHQRVAAGPEHERVVAGRVAKRGDGLEAWHEFVAIGVGLQPVADGRELVERVRDVVVSAREALQERELGRGKVDRSVGERRRVPHRNAADVVAVEVRHDDAIDGAKLHPERGHRRHQLAAARPGVDQRSHAARIDTSWLTCVGTPSVGSPYSSSVATTRRCSTLVPTAESGSVKAASLMTVTVASPTAKVVAETVW